MALLSADQAHQLDKLLVACERGCPADVDELCLATSSASDAKGSRLARSVRVTQEGGNQAFHYDGPPPFDPEDGKDPWMLYSTPLRAAIHGNHLGLVRYLVQEHHVDVHEGRPDSGSLPHNYAASLGSLPIVKFLVETCGLSVSEGSTAEWKLKNQPKDGGDSFVLRSACASGRVAMVRYVLEKGVDVNHPDPINGGTPLECACASGNSDIVQLLVEAGASVNTPARHCSCCAGWTPLHEAAACTAEAAADIVAWLVMNGSTQLNVQCTGKDNITPLDMAFEAENLPVAKVLLSFGAVLHLHRSEFLPQLMLRNGWTQLQVCADFRLPLIAAWLLERGADPHHCPNVSASPWELAGRVSAFNGDALCHTTHRLLHRASQPWRPASHRLFGPRFRDRIRLLYLVSIATSLRDCAAQLPSELWLKIGGFMLRSTVLADGTPQTQMQQMQMQMQMQHHCNKVVDLLEAAPAPGPGPDGELQI